VENAHHSVAERHESRPFGIIKMIKFFLLLRVKYDIRTVPHRTSIIFPSSPKTLNAHGLEIDGNKITILDIILGSLWYGSLSAQDPNS